MEEEIWKSVHELGVPSNHFGHTYSVSNFGRVRNDNTQRILSVRPNKDGYHRANISGLEFRIHRLVAMLFIENPHPDKYNEVNHIDLDKTNNHHSNLEWCDRDYNMKHLANSGTLDGISRGENNGRAILTENDVLDIWLNGYSLDYIVENYGLTKGSARNIRLKKTWKYLIPKYLEIAPENNDELIKIRLKKEDNRRKGKLTDDQIIEAYKRLKKGESMASIGRILQCSENTIFGIKTGKQQYIKDLIEEYEKTLMESVK